MIKEYQDAGSFFMEIGLGVCSAVVLIAAFALGAAVIQKWRDKYGR